MKVELGKQYGPEIRSGSLAPEMMLLVHQIIASVVSTNWDWKKQARMRKELGKDGFRNLGSAWPNEEL